MPTPRNPLQSGITTFELHVIGCASRTPGSSVHANASSGGAFHGSSSTPASIERPHRLASIEYGFAAECAIGISCSRAKAIASGRESGRSRSGARTVNDGTRARAPPARCALDRCLCRCTRARRYRRRSAAPFRRAARRSTAAKARPKADTRLGIQRWRRARARRSRRQKRSRASITTASYGTKRNRLGATFSSSAAAPFTAPASMRRSRRGRPSSRRPRGRRESSV